MSPGDAAPPFSAHDADGRSWSKEALGGRAFILFFYPKDNTPGCVREACGFRDAYGEFEKLDVPVLGVSRDDATSHKTFADKHALPFPLLMDQDGRMHEDYGATMLGGLPRRITYLVDANGRVAEAFESNLNPEVHARRMLEAARALGLS